MASNLTRDEARDRAGLLNVRAYHVELDLTGGETTFTSVTTVTFGCSRPGAGTFVDLIAPAVSAVTLNGEPVGTGSFDGNRIAAGESGGRQRAAWSTPTAPTPAPARACTASSTRSTASVYLYTAVRDVRRAPGLRLLRPARPQGHVRIHGHGAGGLAGGLQHRPPDATGELDAGRAERVALRADAADVARTSPRSSPGPYHEVREPEPRRRSRSASTAAQSLAEYLDAGRDLRGHPAGLRLLPRARSTIRYPFGKYDQLFVPEFNAGAMENAGCVTFLEDYVFRSKVTDSAVERRADDDPARDGAHVVRRPGHHALVGRPVAERVVRRPGRRRWRQAEATRWTDAWTTFAQLEKTWAYRQDQLPSTHPIAADIPDLEAVEVNFDGITYAKGAAVLKQLVAYVGQDDVPRRPARLLQPSTPGATPRCGDLLARAGGDLRPGPGRLVEASGWRPPGSTRCGPSITLAARRHVHRRSRSCRRHPTRTRRCVRTGSRSGCTTWSTAGLVRRRPGRDSTSPARAPRCRSWLGRPGPTWCWSTTTT